MPKDNLKDKLDGNELDLGLSNISVVPVKDLAALPKATRLDLSCNAITSLPDSFCLLIHLIKIDLSKNTLKGLPETFGSLANLQHLDLLGNRLKSLPVSFSQLNKLKWLDLKDNPLEPKLKKVAGDCLDESQCRKCAHQVVSHLKVVSSDMERLQQLKLKKKKNQDAAKKAKEEEEIQKARNEKKAAKQKKKLEQQQQAQLKQVKNNARVTEHRKEEKPPKNAKKSNANRKKKTSGGWMSPGLVVLSVLALLFAVLLGLFFFCQQNADFGFCDGYWSPAVEQTVESSHRVLNYTKQQASFIYSTCKPYINSSRAYVNHLYSATIEVVESLFSSTSKAESDLNQATG